MMTHPDLSLEGRYHGVVCGVDEAGRGPLAGPVVAAAVVFPDGIPDPRIVAQVRDSKAMTAHQRATMFTVLQETALVATGQATVAEIDQINILQASLLAMRRAVLALSVMPDVVLVDGNRCPDLETETIPVIRGDRTSLTIAAASVIAKQTRDGIMHELAVSCPQYGWDRNAGYPTKAHRQALEHFGPSPHHRRSFAPVRQVLEGCV